MSLSALLKEAEENKENGIQRILTIYIEILKLRLIICLLLILRILIN